MRNLKFRAWDKKEKKWLLGYEYPNLGGFSMIGETMMLGEYASLLSAYFPDRLDDIEVMQFTGLKDKNGKEIYEGDIYKTKNGVTGEEMKLIVRYNHASFGLVRNGSSSMNPKNLASKHNIENGEVIGNIYENPELLKTV